MKATLSSTAARELREAADYIASENRRAARSFVLAVDDALATIGKHPDIGAERLELAEPPIRFWTVQRYHYLLVYNCKRSPPRVLHILHGSRDLPELLSDLRTYSIPFSR